MNDIAYVGALGVSQNSEQQVIEVPFDTASLWVYLTDASCTTCAQPYFSACTNLKNLANVSFGFNRQNYTVFSPSMDACSTNMNVSEHMSPKSINFYLILNSTNSEDPTLDYPWPGSLGLGYSRGDHTFLHQINDQFFYKSLAFSIAGANGTSTVEWGATDPDLYTGSLFEIERSMDNDLLDYWLFDIQRVEYGSMALGLENPSAIIATAA